MDKKWNGPTHSTVNYFSKSDGLEQKIFLSKGK